MANPNMFNKKTNIPPGALPAWCQTVDKKIGDFRVKIDKAQNNLNDTANAQSFKDDVNDDVGRFAAIIKTTQVEIVEANEKADALQTKVHEQLEKLQEAVEIDPRIYKTRAAELGPAARDLLPFFLEIFEDFDNLRNLGPDQKRLLLNSELEIAQRKIDRLEDKVTRMEAQPQPAADPDPDHFVPIHIHNRVADTAARAQEWKDAFSQILDELKEVRIKNRENDARLANEAKGLNVTIQLLRTELHEEQIARSRDLQEKDQALKECNETCTDLRLEADKNLARENQVYSELSTRIHDLEDQLDSASSNQSQIRHAHDDATSRLDTLLAEHETLKLESSELEQKLTKLDDLYGQSKTTAEKANTQLETLQREIQTMATEMQERKESTEALAKLHQESIGKEIALEQAKIAAEGECERLRITNQALQDSAEALTFEVETARKERETALTDHEAARNALDLRQQEAEEAYRRIVELEDERVELLHERNAHRASIAHLETSREAAGAANQRSQTELQEAQHRNLELEANIQREQTELQHERMAHAASVARIKTAQEAEEAAEAAIQRGQTELQHERIAHAASIAQIKSAEEAAEATKAAKDAEVAKMLETHEQTVGGLKVEIANQKRAAETIAEHIKIGYEVRLNQLAEQSQAAEQTLAKQGDYINGVNRVVAGAADFFALTSSIDTGSTPEFLRALKPDDRWQPAQQAEPSPSWIILESWRPTDEPDPPVLNDENSIMSIVARLFGQLASGRVSSTTFRLLGAMAQRSREANEPILARPINLLLRTAISLPSDDLHENDLVCIGLLLISRLIERRWSLSLKEVPGLRHRLQDSPHWIQLIEPLTHRSSRAVSELCERDGVVHGSTALIAMHDQIIIFDLDNRTMRLVNRKRGKTAGFANLQGRIEAPDGCDDLQFEIESPHQMRWWMML